MFNQVKRMDSSEGNVWKYIFEADNAIAESVLYRYDDFYERTVICCSVMSGCPVGCKFCGTGKKFIRNLTPDEIVYQIQYSLKDWGIESDINSKCKKFQIMFMSMGEPMLNWKNVEIAIEKLNHLYPNAALLISTMGVDKDDVFADMIRLSMSINKVGLQFSIHKAMDEDRNELIPFQNKMSLRKIRDAGLTWNKATGRPVYLNYCVEDGVNNRQQDIDRLQDMFSPTAFNMTFSVICNADETMKDARNRQLSIVEDIANKFIEAGYNTRTFNPAGQDDIGGGCGQLWYVQRWLKQYSTSK